MAILKNTSIAGTEYLQITRSNTNGRPIIQPIVQSFTTVGTTTWTAPANVNEIEVLVVAGGGGGGGFVGGGGGGAGGLLYRSNYSVTPGTSYTVIVGAGGIGGRNSTQTGSIDGLPGENSRFDALIAIGGGGGSRTAPGIGGSGGGGSLRNIAGGAGTAGQGFRGGAAVPGASSTGGGGGGGGAGGPGTDGIFQHSTSLGNGGGGGIGLNYSISGTSTWYAGGGGGGGRGDLGVLRGAGSQGGGGRGQDLNNLAQPGQANTGGGGGGGGGSNDTTSNGAAGGSGIVIIRYFLTEAGEDPRGLIRYNTDVNGLEFYEGNGKGWIAENPTKNFAWHNLIRYSQDFNLWTSAASVTANTTTAPDGTLTADTSLNPANSFSPSILVTYQDNVTYTMSTHIHSSSTATWLRYRVNTVGAASLSFWFNVQTGVFGTLNTGFSNASARDIGGGWRRISVQYRPITGDGGARNTSLMGSPVTGDASSTVDTGRTVVAWGAQVEEASSLGPYVQTFEAVNPVPANINGYRIHAFTSVGSYTFIPACTGLVDILVVAGGGAGGSDNAGGGGGGGVIYQTEYRVISGRRYPITVGGGGSGQITNIAGDSGGNSRFGPLVAIGGGGGGGGDGGGAQVENPILDLPGRAGGSGGGGASEGDAPGGPGVEGQGFRGGNGVGGAGGGGGGAGGPGSNALGAASPGNGGPGLPCDITGTTVWYGAGGAGAPENSTVNLAYSGLGGLGGGGTSNPGNTDNVNKNALQNNTGAGGAGIAFFGSNVLGGNGASGTVVVRYRMI